MKKFFAVVLLIIMVINISACSIVRKGASRIFQEFAETTAPVESTASETTAPVTIQTEPAVAGEIRYYDIQSYLFTVTNPDRVIFDAPDGKYVQVFDEVGVYTIVQEAVDTQGVKWGKLKSGVGWVRFDNNVLPALDMTFSSGAGAWSTQLEIYADGTFSGVYHDSDMGSTGEGYPHGTVYYSKFSGKFTDVTIIDRYTLSLTLEYMNTTTPAGEIEYKDNQKVVYTEPYGLNGGSEFLLYLPKKDVSGFSESLLSWCRYAVSDSGKTTDRYILHNTANEQGFVESVY